jgi:ABC-2 type transport system permease protein
MDRLKNIFTIAYYTILRYIRDVKTLTSMLFLPIILIIILGTALDKYFTVSKIEPIKVALVNKDKGEISKSFEEFLKIEDVKAILQVERFEDYDKALEELKDKDLSALIYLEENLSENVKEGKENTIKILGSKYSTFKRNVVQKIVDSYVNGANTMEAMYKISTPDTIKDVKYENKTTLKEEIFSITGTKPRAIDYYAVTMLVMILMYGTMYGSYSFGEDNFETIGIRVKTTPVKYSEIFIGKCLGIVFTLFWQFIVLILVSKYMYKANFGTNLWIIIFICFTLSVLATFLGMAVCTIVKNEKVAGAILNIVVPVATFVAGGYTPFSVEPNSIFEKVRYMSPNYLAQTAIFNNIYGGPSAQTQSCIVTMWVMIIGLIIIASLFGRRLLGNDSFSQ